MALSLFAAQAWSAPPNAISNVSHPARQYADLQSAALDIKVQSVTDALTTWAQQTGLQVIVPDGPDADKLIVSPLIGEFTAQEALTQLLSNTNLRFEFINARTVVIRERATAGGSVEAEVGIKSTAVSSDSAAEDASRGKAKSGIDASTLFANLQIGEVLVTGSHIRGMLSAGAHVRIMDRTDIDDTGYTTVQDIIRTIPANMGGGPSEDFDDGVTGNFNRGVGINLRRLGSGATLVLVNGRRQPSSSTGTFVDVSSIPSSAISRMDVLTDGASAIYGADAVGGVVNIVLRDEFEGAESRVHYDFAGDPRQRHVSQIMGTSWNEGNLLLGYQFDERDALPRSARAYSAHEDQRPFGGDDFRLVMSNPGNILNPMTGLPMYAIPTDQDGSKLRPQDLLTDRVNLQGFEEVADLLPRQEMHSAYFRVNQHLGDNFSVSADGRFSRRAMQRQLFAYPAIMVVPASNPFFVDPFGGAPAVLVAYNFLDDLGPVTGRGHTDVFTGTVDASVDMDNGWRASVAATYGQEKMQWQGDNLIDAAALGAALSDPDPATAFNPFGDGSHTNPATLAAIRHTQHERAESSLQNVTVTADGAVLDMPGGVAKMAVGLDYRQESLASRASDFSSLDRGILAAFTEIALPFFGADNARAGAKELELSLAARFENYSDVGSALNPRIGMNWTPADIVRLRATWGTSFKAPSLLDGHVSPTSSIVSLAALPDPQSPTGQSTVLLKSGASGQLQNETATVWNAGLDFMLPGETAPTLSLTYYHIDFRDQIAEGGPLGAPGNILLQESQWSDLIDRNPAQTQIKALCTSPEFSGDPATCNVTTIAAIVDIRRRNLGEVAVQGIDLNASRQIPTAWGQFGVEFEGNYVLHHRIAANKKSPLLDVVDTVGNPLALRLRGSISWQLNQWSANAYTDYTGGYRDNLSRTQRNVGSWTTVDLRFGYQTGQRADWWGDVEISLNATNVFDKDPPFYNSRYGYDVANADPLGRVLSARITKWW